MKQLRKCLVFIIAAMLLYGGIQNVYGIPNDGNKYALNSKLEQGKWIKIKVEENAIYKLSYSDIQEMGLDPANTRIFGYGGWPLDEDFTKAYVDDLPEVACWKSGSSTQFNSDDFLLFYGRGTVKWRWNNVTREYVHENNPYSTYGVYFLTDAIEGTPKRMEIKPSAPSFNVTITSFEDYMVHEKEIYSIAKMGRELHGESFGMNNTQDFFFNIPGITENTGSVTLSFASTAGNNTSLTLNVNNSADQLVNLINTVTNFRVEDGASRAFTVNQKASWYSSKVENTIIQISHPCGVKAAYLNYIRLNMTRKLQYYDTNYTFFRSSENFDNGVRYNIQNATSNLLVFDVTDNFNTKQIQTTFSSDVLSFNTESGYSSAVREFVLVDPEKSFPIPQRIPVEVGNQNLHGLEQTDMVIISPELFVSEAERLADYHRNSSRGLTVHVVTPEQIYNEFSSGVPDASAYRRFMKMFYDRGTNNSNRPKYLLLFGASVFDNRFLDPSCSKLPKENYLLCYQTNETAIRVDEVCPADDYFGFLDEYDENKSLGDRDLKLGIGRFSVRTFAEAQKVVDKTISYMENKNYGYWKNSVVFVADDSDTTAPIQYPYTALSSFAIHLKQMDSIANSTLTKYNPEYALTKIYMDAYVPENAGGKRKFDNSARAKVMKALNDGCLVFNYTGHGGNVGIAHDVLTLSDVHQMRFENLPLWITSTCDFADFDATGVSIGEAILLNEKSGGIALFATTRVAYAQYNLMINLPIIRNLFNKEGAFRPTLGDVLRVSKNEIKTSASSNYKNNKMKFVLLGDPALTLHYPEYEIEIDKINGKQVNGEPVVIRALEKVEVLGHIKDEEGKIDKSFNGNLFAKVFDSMQTIQSATVTQPSDSGKVFYAYFNDYPNLIARPQTTVKNGKFKFSFMVMKDIADITAFGKMNMYAYSASTGIEAQSSFMNYQMYGIDPSVDLQDKQVPVVTAIYLNEPTFKSGDVVNETPYFVAKVEDKFGINFSGAGIGHDIRLIINNSRERNYSLNDFYTTTGDNSGAVAFSIPELPEGKHKLTFQVWNILNNVTVKHLDFTVKKGIRPQMSDLSAVPNPAKTGTEVAFLFTHDRPEMRITVEVRVCDLSGRLVWSHTESGSPEGMYEVTWNLKNDEGLNVQPGVYIYNAIVKSEGGGTEATNSKKLIVVER